MLLREVLVEDRTTRMVPAEGIEPPTFGLQNHCSTAELSRHGMGRVGGSRHKLAGRRIPELAAKGHPRGLPFPPHPGSHFACACLRRQSLWPDKPSSLVFDA